MDVLSTITRHSDAATRLLEQYESFAERNVGPYPKPIYGGIETNLTLSATYKSVRAERRRWHAKTIHKGAKALVYHTVHDFFENDMD